MDSENQYNAKRRKPLLTLAQLLILVSTMEIVSCFTHLSSYSLFGRIHHRHSPSIACFGTTTDRSSATATSESSIEDKAGEYDLTLLSPCKINLFLRILRKREDGYHDLASLFQTIGFGDTLQFKLLENNQEDMALGSKDGSENKDLFECNMEGVPRDRSNLVLRAVDLMRKKTGQQNKRFKINLIKQVPAQAGLGGGSANAATAMFAVNELLGKPATHEQMVDWSGELGSDITFFFSLGSAYCTGRGEIMTPIDPPLPAGTKITIVKPNIGLSTPAVFKALEYDKLSDNDPEELLRRFQSEGVVDISDDAYINDLENPAFKVVPQLLKLKKDLQKVEGFRHVCMSGSGTSIFCIGEAKDPDAFESNFGPQKRNDLKVFKTEFISRQDTDNWWV